MLKPKTQKSTYTVPPKGTAHSVSSALIETLMSMEMKSSSRVNLTPTSRPTLTSIDNGWYSISASAQAVSHAWSRPCVQCQFSVEFCHELRLRDLPGRSWLVNYRHPCIPSA